MIRSNNLFSKATNMLLVSIFMLIYSQLTYGQLKTLPSFSEVDYSMVLEHSFPIHQRVLEKDFIESETKNFNITHSQTDTSLTSTIINNQDLNTEEILQNRTLTDFDPLQHTLRIHVIDEDNDVMIVDYLPDASTNTALTFRFYMPKKNYNETYSVSIDSLEKLASIMTDTGIRGRGRITLSGLSSISLIGMDGTNNSIFADPLPLEYRVSRNQRIGNSFRRYQGNYIKPPSGNDKKKIYRFEADTHPIPLIYILGAVAIAGWCHR